jgi:hypothetical protein
MKKRLESHAEQTAWLSTALKFDDYIKPFSLRYLSDPGW